MIKNIIFDLGGVILDVDYNRAVEAFRNLSIPDFNALYSQQKQALFFDRFEKGALSAAEFRQVIRNMNQSLDDASIDKAWNSMILETPPERMDFLEKLKTRFGLYLLSNTNEIHIRHFQEYFSKTFGPGRFESLFKKIYLSSLLGMRKPEAGIFKLVISENVLNPEETVFIDDSVQHVEGARQTGLHTLLLPSGKKIESFLLPALEQFQ